MSLTVMQLLPALDVGGVERGTLDVAAALVDSGHRAVVVSAGGRLVDELTALGATHENLPIGAKRWHTLGCIRPLRELIRSHAPDIVHARSRLPAWIGHRALRGMPANERPAWVTTVHGPYTVNAYSRIMTSGDRVIAISQFIREYIETNYPGVEPARIRVIPRGIDPRVFPSDHEPAPAWREAFASQFPRTRNRRLLVVPGRITRWKGQAEFLRLMARLIARGRDVHGLIAGGADRRSSAYADELRQQIAALGLAEHVSLLGARDDMPDVLAHADIAYSLTLEPEAFGRTTAEALSVGTPVIGYDHGGTGEILRAVLPQGLAPVGDIAAVAALSEQFLDASPPVPAEHPYTLARLQAATLAVYDELCAGGGPDSVQREKS